MTGTITTIGKPTDRNVKVGEFVIKVFAVASRWIKKIAFTIVI